MLARISLAVVLLAPCLLHADPPAETKIAFRRHTLNADSEFSACAVFDVNRDGKLDVFSGGWWYEAPNWTRHRVRDVEMIRGRYDDYSNLPLDVNGDGWPDVVSVNYRSRSLYWVEHPGADWKSDATWQRHVIDEPGPSETGRLADIDSDGQLDVLPNGTKFAAWYEPTTKQGKPTWTRHDLPDEIIGHGLGFGDINGDGRGDLVSPQGWLAAPEDRRAQRWRWHREFQLHRDAGIPIVVHDVDGDGDSDLIWGRGHNVGLYWAEQQSTDGKRDWIQHTIDTEWSAAHSLLMGDIDGDGRADLVTGKRYLGHDGKDPGEYHPLPIYWYRFDSDRKTWRRQLISALDGIGFDLDPKLEDLDGDGDTDIVAPSRNGLYWFENQRVAPSAKGDLQVASPAPQYDDHSQLLVLRGGADQPPQPVTTPFQWGLRRRHILAGMQLAMGRLPEPHVRVPLDVQVKSVAKTENYDRIELTFQAEPGDRVPAYLLVPHDLQQPAPAMLCLHQTTRIGKGEPAGLGGRESLHYAHELANRGYICLAPDYPSFGDYSYDFKTGVTTSGSMKAIWNNMRAVDLLEARSDVNGDRIGVIGHSLGGHNALFSAAFDQRLRAVVTSCGFTSFHDYYGGKLAGWTSNRYMPRIREEYHNDPDEVPFDFYGVIAALAPRPLFINAPQHDGNFEVGGVRKVVRQAGRVYDFTGNEDGIRAEYPDSGHDFPDAIRNQAYQWLDRHLKK